MNKFTSNARLVLDVVPKDLRTKNLQICEIDRDKLSIEQTLGIFWCGVENDKFCFRIILDNRSPTRRVMLSTISAIYDPFGLVSPVLLTGSKILQELTLRRDLEWDDPIDKKIRCMWEA